MAQYIYLRGPIILIYLSIPLALLAVITTTLALCTLLLRVSTVYLELGLNLVHGWLTITPSKPTARTYATRQEIVTPLQQWLQRKSSHRQSAALNEASITQSTRIQARLSTSESFSSLLGSAGPTRDFEGVGGWRLESDRKDEAAWLSMNSRLQMPAPTPPVERYRMHKRSMSSQSQNLARSPETMRMSPVDRSRTPPAAQSHHEGVATSYFNLQPDCADMSPEEASTVVRMDERRLSLSSSGASSVTVSDLKGSTSALTQLQPS